MTKLRPFSIYLLKQGFTAANALNQDHTLDAVTNAANLPAHATLYILDSERRRPWWRDYFGISKDLWQVSKGALIFLPVCGRCFALSFGHVFHHVKDIAYEYDFGLIVTLNSLDPNKLKSADMLEPGEARRKRTQVPVSTELTYLDFDGNSEIIKSLTGKVKAEYGQLFKDATGSSSFKVNLSLEPSGLRDICRRLLELYQKEDYKTTFPNIRNIAPTRDPSIVSKLNQNLVVAIRTKNIEVTLTIPDIVEYRGDTCCVFHGGGQSEVYPDISIEKFYDYLGQDFDLDTLTADSLRNYQLILTDSDGKPGSSYSIFRSLIYETSLAGDNASYHLNEGNWYKVEANYAAQLRAYLDSKCEDTDLCPYNHDEIKNGRPIYSEERYNLAMPNWQSRFLCMDQTNIAPIGNIEPCDLYSVVDDETSQTGSRGVFYHVKISTRSAQLSHLFNQGINALDLIQLEPQARSNLKELVAQKLNGSDEDRYMSPINNGDFRVVFAVITRKNRDAKSENLPLFSKITLRRIMQQFDLRRVPCALTFVEDQSPPKAGYSRHKQVIVEVRKRHDGKKIVRPIVGQGVDVDQEVNYCPKEIRESAEGTRFRVSLKVADDGSLSTHHDWPYQKVA